MVWEGGLRSFLSNNLVNLIPVLVSSSYPLEVQGHCHFVYLNE